MSQIVDGLIEINIKNELYLEIMNVKQILEFKYLFLYNVTLFLSFYNGTYEKYRGKP